MPAEWCGGVRSKLEHLSLTNVEYHCVPMSTATPRPCVRSPCGSSYQQYRDYIETPAKLPYRYDVVLVDGRARPQCAVFVREYLRDEDSVGANQLCSVFRLFLIFHWVLIITMPAVIMHDWNERTNYHTVLQVFDIVAQQVRS